MQLLINGSIGSFLTPLKEFRFIMSVLYLGALSSSEGTHFNKLCLSKDGSLPKIECVANLATVIYHK